MTTQMLSQVTVSSMIHMRSMMWLACILSTRYKNSAASDVLFQSALVALFKTLSCLQICKKRYDSVNGNSGATTSTFKKTSQGLPNFPSQQLRMMVIHFTSRRVVVSSSDDHTLDRTIGSLSRYSSFCIFQVHRAGHRLFEPGSG